VRRNSQLIWTARRAVIHRPAMPSSSALNLYVRSSPRRLQQARGGGGLAAQTANGGLGAHGASVSRDAPEFEWRCSALDDVVLDRDDAGRVTATLEILSTVVYSRNETAPA
jgi:hypothetical protein